MPSIVRYSAGDSDLARRWPAVGLPRSTEATMRTNPDRGDATGTGLLDVLIRAGLILALALLCYRVFAPFLVLMVWAVILAVTLYPLQQAIARRIGHRKGLAATIIALLG